MLNTEFGRSLPSVAFTPNQPQSVRLPTDVALKRLNIRLSGSVLVTYASGSPVGDVTGFFNRICPIIEVVLDGGETIKSASPFQFQQSTLFLAAVFGEQRYSTSSSAPSTRVATTDGKIGAYPATTYYITINESVTLEFEDRWAYSFGSEVTILNMMRSVNPELRFKFSSFGNVQDANSAAVSVAYTANTMQFDTTTVEAHDVMPTDQFYVYREYGISRQFSGQQRDFAVDLNTGNALQGVLFIVRNGDATRSLSNVALEKIALRLNGSNVIRESSFLELQSENVQRRGLNVPTVSTVRRVDGCAYLSTMKNGDIRNCLDLSYAAGVRQAQLLLTTAAASGNDSATYTAPVEVLMLVQEIYTPPALRPKAA